MGSVEEETAEHLTEKEEIEQQRRRFFFEVLGDSVTADQIEKLVESESSPHDAQKLKDNECPPDLIVDILV